MMTVARNATKTMPTKAVWEGTNPSDVEATLTTLPVEDFDHDPTVRDDRTTEAKTNEGLRMLVVGLGIVSSMLIGVILATVVGTTARTTVPVTGMIVEGFGRGTTRSSAASTGVFGGATEIDIHTGIAYAAEGNEHPVLKTDDVIVYSDTLDIATMTNAELTVLKELLFDEDNIKFVVKGYGRGTVSQYNTQTHQYHDATMVHVLVEGGTLTWDADGLADASGEAVLMILESAFPDDSDAGVVASDSADSDNGSGGNPHRRRLPASCKKNVRRSRYRTGSGSSNNSRSF